ncbi:hypothetical protein A1Q1_05739 [Trichosporon asahii var. asahii CBS 2479]|uniref:P-loop containing nucleoside triphosphate hydrolase protein n=1 Tax=Trichosporon asahii var. asahii (strain ATCC 90039 / CBS 2479 / JCM 2466 / KCTC 7840 / NBRC 103889/ NCYC 2677 / UAMH 7654) TaxID=1186058 RepID=J5SIP2_TRIAS|nr:hypothetical protein A1Q1_05739 [Trichosporon asahii var. asahii CBS 2479]EJT45826.1 hypothetical protein A1Q1_05739 [Trichosporon asahii var. asahii CBS 2479]
MKNRVIMVGVGCSGKSLLTTHLHRLAPSFAVHQDDFAPAQEDIPIHPVHKVQDWDDPPTAIDWARMRSVLRHVRSNGRFEDGYKSYQHLNDAVEVGVDEDATIRLRREFAKIQKHAAQKGERLTYVLVDGFMLYYDTEVQDNLDVKLLLRVPRETLKKRREGRHFPCVVAELTSDAKDAETGATWVDPPEYFDNDKSITLLEPGEGQDEVTRIVDEACAAILGAYERGLGNLIG